MFVYELYDERDSLPFHFIRMPHLDSNIPESIFYSALVGEFIRIARSTLLVEDFIEKTKILCKRMIKQGANRHKISQNIKKIISRHTDEFNRFQLTSEELISHLL